MNKKPVIQIRNVFKTYATGEAQVHALNGVSITIERGDFVAVMGRSGSGKSTLMNLLGLLDVPTKGRYFLDGVDVRGLDEDQLATLRNRKIGFVFQGFNLLPRTSAVSNVELPLLYAGLGRQQRHQHALAALEAVGLANRVNHQPSELSGGQQQRVAVARAIVNNPALILADEPTGNLDSAAAHEVLDMFERLHNEGRTIVLITHEADVAERARRVLHFQDGQIVSDELNAAMPEHTGIVKTAGKAQKTKKVVAS